MSELSCIFSRTSSGMKKSASYQVRDICNWLGLSCLQNLLKVCLFVFGATVPSGPGPPHSRGF